MTQRVCFRKVILSMALGLPGPGPAMRFHSLSRSAPDTLKPVSQLLFVNENARPGVARLRTNGLSVKVV
jgi:hypothetical protein